MKAFINRWLMVIIALLFWGVFWIIVYTTNLSIKTNGMSFTGFIVINSVIILLSTLIDFKIKKGFDE